MDTIAAVATPPGEGALAIVRIGGPDALSIARELCGRELRARHATRVGIEGIDEAVAVYYPKESSPIGEDLVELTLHGGSYIAEQVMSRALMRARLAEAGEFTRRAFLNGKLDLAQAEAVSSLIRARSQAGHRSALRQLSGGLSAKISALRLPVLELCARVEACLDHPEEDIPSLSPAQARAALDAARAPIEALAASFRAGRLAAEGARLAFVGAPNAGKSSLFNALLGRDRAIVRPEAGTTRDTLEEPARIDGRAAVLIDTAGLRERCSEPAEEEGMRRTEQALESCDLAVLVLDGGCDGDAERRILAAAGKRGTPVVKALSKADLGPRDGDGVSVSAVTGAGLDGLRREIAARLGPVESDAVTSARHHAALLAAAGELAQAAGLAGTPGWEERAAWHLRQANSELGLILGEGATDEVLHEIFSRFCVGK